MKKEYHIAISQDGLIWVQGEDLWCRIFSDPKKAYEYMERKDEGV